MLYRLRPFPRPLVYGNKPVIISDVLIRIYLVHSFDIHGLPEREIILGKRVTGLKILSSLLSFSIFLSAFVIFDFFLSAFVIFHFLSVSLAKIAK